jgi:hypothetical protein
LFHIRQRQAAGEIAFQITAQTLTVRQDTPGEYHAAVWPKGRQLGGSYPWKKLLSGTAQSAQYTFILGVQRAIVNPFFPNITEVIAFLRKGAYNDGCYDIRP